MCEETSNPSREVPRAIFLSVAAAGVTGILYLIPILFSLPPASLLLEVANGQPIGLLFKTVTGSAGGGFGLLFLILGIMFFAGIGSLCAASRCTYAFARDGAIPGSRWWSRVNKGEKWWQGDGVPVPALMLCFVIDCLLGLIYFGSTSAFNAFTGVATLSLSASYGLPILVSVLRGRKAVKHSTFSLGSATGYAINTVTLCWIALAVVLFCVPTAKEGLTPQTMNYASVVFAGFATVSIVWYFIRGRKDFHGPPIVRGDVDLDGDRSEGSDGREDVNSA